MRQLHFYWIPLLAALGLGWFFHPSRQLAEVHWIDQLQRLSWSLQRPAQTPPVRVLLIDEITARYLGKPSVLWTSDFGQLAQGLLAQGAKGVLFDYIFPLESDKMPADFQAQFQAQQLPLLVALSSGKVGLGDRPDSPGDPGTHNAPALQEAASQYNNLCELSLQSDADGCYRGLLLAAFCDQPQPLPSLALRAVELLGHKVDRVRQGWSLDGHPIATEGNPLNPLLRSSYRRPELPAESASNILKKLSEGQSLPEAKDAVYIIAPALGDYRPSAYDQLSSKRQLGGTLGVEHHLAAIETMLSGRYLIPYSPAQGCLVCLLVSLAFFAAGLRLPPRQGLLALMSGLLGYGGLCAGLFLGQGLWLPMVSAALSGIVAYACAYFLRFITLERQRQLTLRMFSRMVAPQVVDKVLSDPTAQKIGGSARRLTVLYTDINDFTPVCERHTPTEVIELLNQYFEEMVESVFQYQGCLKQFVGDEIMCIYGAPVEQPDHAARAVLTALDMLDRLDRMAAAAQGADGFFDIKVGINTGDVVIGQVGSDRHMEYAAVGDDVNLGARIMATTKKLGVKILVSAVTKQEAEPLLPEVEWISHGVHSFKGKSVSLEVFEVRRKKEKARPVALVT